MSEVFKALNLSNPFELRSDQFPMDCTTKISHNRHMKIIMSDTSLRS